MKTLYIIRHAKSDQSFFGNDFERPLNERGKTDAPMMAKRLLDKKIEIELLVSSPAILQIGQHLPIQKKNFYFSTILKTSKV